MTFRQITEEELQKMRDVEIHQFFGLVNRGRRVSINCPLPNHNDKTPSFTIYPNNTYKCYGCGVQGAGAVDFLMDIGGKFREVMEELEQYI